MPEFRFYIQLSKVLITCVLSVLLSSCSTGPKPAELLDIARVEVTPEPLTTNYTAMFTLVMGDSLDEPYRVAWKLGQPDGSVIDTLTNTPRFYWTAPPQSGEYTHTVSLQTQAGEPLTKEYTFSVQVIPWNPPPSGNTLSGKIVFSAGDANNEYQIFTMNGDGSGLQQLTEWTSPSTSPSWSPDGQQIVFSSSYKANNVTSPALWVMNADGSEARLVQEGDRLPLLGSNPRWSPDGEKIVYSFYNEFQVDIYMYNMISGKRRRLTNHNADDTYPSWSPDGHRILFTSDRDYIYADSMRYRSDLYMINIDGSGLNRLTDSGNAIRPKWGTNGKKIAYEWNVQKNEVFLYNFESREHQKIETGMNISVEPQWNKYGTQLIVFGRQSYQTPLEIRLFKIEGNNSAKLQTVKLDKSPIGRDYDWYDPE
jgi:hypothetical protein